MTPIMSKSKDSVTQWAGQQLEKLKQKMPYAVQKAQGLPFLPYTVRDGEWAPATFDGICWWTNGFWPAMMVRMHEVTGQAIYLAEARRAEAMLDGAFADFEHLHHDVGFMWRISSGFDFELTGDMNNRRRVLLAAQLLAGRYNPNGFIRAWNEDRAGWTIIDCMMNLSLLYWASAQTNDPRYRLIAIRHADTALTHFMRADGTCEHIVIFDPETGAVVDKPGGQGYAPGTAWSRGMAWAIYGFAISHQHTGNPAYLAAAQRVADAFIHEVKGDWLPVCDFRAPAEPVIKDDCAAGIAAGGMLSIADALGEQGATYLDAAVRLLMAMEEAHADWSVASPAIFTHCTGSYHANDHHIAMVYGDYFFVEGVIRLMGGTKLVW